MANVREAKQFVQQWQGKGDEKQETQAFWIQLLDQVFEDHNYNKDIQFEQTADKIEGGKFFKDAVIHRHTDHAVLIEQKGMKYALDQKEPRHGLMLTPFEQAKEYDDKSAFDDKARWIITCNFKEFWIYDMTKTGRELYTPVAKLKLEDLPKHLDWLAMIGEGTEIPKQTFTEEVEVSTKAGELVGILYDDLHKNYHNPDDPETLRQLNILCVRIVFCLYAEDAGLFDKDNRKMFHDYLAQFDARGMRRALGDLFKVLDQTEDERDPYLADDNPMLAAFPYVNGGLFEGDVIIPPFTDETVDILLNKESMGFDWSKISPTIFGAVFESTLNQETRRKGGMHYTSLENIHKVIDPLFLDDLNKELDEILALKTHNIRNRRLREFQDKLSQIRCFDPACGSGNFLTESYLSLRRLENKALKARLGQNMAFGFEEADLTPIKVSIQQFYGIEINDFAVSVAKTALWIAEAEMFEETQTILNSDKDFLPLKTFTNIHEGNALRTDWNTIIDRRTEHLYIIGNPPFVGHQWRTQNQVKDMESVFYDMPKHGKLDYVCAWFYKAANFIQNTKTKVAFVSTNSICQGESVADLWKPLFKKGIEIIFCHRTFVWQNEAVDQAAVHCIIVGFATKQFDGKKYIFDETGEKNEASNINGYLVDADNIFIQSRGKPEKRLPIMTKGSQPTDGLGLILEQQDYDAFLTSYPDKGKLIRQYMGSYEMINSKKRYCLWLKDIPISEYQNNQFILERLKQVSNFRKTSATESVRQQAKTPYLFTQIRQPDTDYLAFPAMSSSRRKYIPICYLSKNIIASNQLYILPSASLYLFGVLTSNVHMLWTKTVCGRLKSDYRYAPAVYNNFPWPTITDTQKQKIETTAQAILDARKNHSDATLADMYDPDKEWIYLDLMEAHQANDRAVMDAYGFRKDMSESDIVAALMKMYQELVQKQSIS